MGYIDVQKITHLRLLCKKVLPAVYDESLSYLEGLAKLTHKLNEVINNVNAMDDNIDMLNESVIDLNQRVEVVENSVDTFLEQMTAAFEELTKEYDAKIDAKLAEVDEELVNVDARVSALEQSIDSKFAEFEKEINTAIRNLTRVVNEEVRKIQELYSSFEIEMKEYIEEEVRKAISEIPDLTTVYVIDPTTGKLTKIQKALDNVFLFNAYNALTVDEWNALGMTVDEANHIIVKSIPRGMTIIEWLHDAKLILLEQIEAVKARVFAYPHSFVKQYLTGEYVWHDKNVDLNQQLIAVSGCYSCDELETMAFTCDEIVNFNISCYDYIMSANAIMVRA